jgi:Fic family protein
MKRTDFGRYAVSVSGDEEVRAFIPAPLPPHPALELSGSAREAFDQALLALGRLDGTAATLPDAQLLLYTYVRKEAVLSSQIEGTQSTLDDLLKHELGAAPGVPIEDVAEVSRYVEAMTHGLKRLRSGFPLSNRLLREMHGILLATGRGAQKTPGEFRRAQNWIGGTRPGNAAFVPPPPREVDHCMAEFERFIHSTTPALQKAALAHVQFETIHPFLDGNGRIGRLLITLLLCSEGVLRDPLLYASLYLKEHRQKYYSELNAVRETGDFERWLEFFASAIRVSAEQATTTGQRVFTVFQEDRKRVRDIGRQAPTALLIQEALQSKPFATIASLTRATGFTTPTVTQALGELERLGIVREVTGRARGRIYAYTRYLEALNTDATGSSRAAKKALAPGRLASATPQARRRRRRN